MLTYAIVLLDWKKSDEKGKMAFEETLAQKHWTQHKTITSVWRVPFEEEISMEDVIADIRAAIEIAKQKSGVASISYSIQIDGELLYGSK